MTLVVVSWARALPARTAARGPRWAWLALNRDDKRAETFLERGHRAACVGAGHRRSIRWPPSGSAGCDRGPRRLRRGLTDLTDRAVLVLHVNGRLLGYRVLGDRLVTTKLDPPLPRSRIAEDSLWW